MVNVKGPGIPSSRDGCSPDLGITSQFVGPGQVVNVEVPAGSDRLFEVYFFHGSGNEACPTKSGSDRYSNIDAEKMYFVGEAGGITVQDDTQSVSIDIAYPGAGSNLASLLGGSCGPTNPGHADGPKNQLGSQQGLISSGSYQMKFNLGSSTEVKELNGTTLKVRTF